MISQSQLLNYQDRALKLGVILTACAVAVWSYYFLDTRIRSKSQRYQLESQVKENADRLQYIGNSDYYVYPDDLVSAEDLYSLGTIKGQDDGQSRVVATTIQPINPLEDGLIRYQKYPIHGYKVHLLVESDLAGLQEYIRRVESQHRAVIWQEVLFDAKNYPRSFGALTYYVLAK